MSILPFSPASSKSPGCNQCKRFFLFHFTNAWLIRQCLTQWCVNTNTPPSHVNAVCDLLAKSLTTPSHRRPPSCLLCLTLHFSITSDFLTHSSLANTIFLSLCLFVVWQRSAPPCPSSTHMRTNTHTYTPDFHKTESHIPLSWRHSP